MPSVEQTVVKVAVDLFRDVEGLTITEVANVHRARVDEVLDEEARSQAGRIARHAVAWDGPEAWMAMVEAEAVPEDLPMAPMPLPEGYRQNSALQQVPNGPRERLARSLEGWALTSGGSSRHRVRLWREEVAHARLGHYHLWTSLEPAEALLVVRERSSSEIAGGAALTLLAGLGAGGFGMLLGPAVAAGAFAFGAGLMAVQTTQVLRRRFATLWTRPRDTALKELG